MHILGKISDFLSRYTSGVCVVAAMLALIWSPSFAWVHGTTQTVILGFIMLTMGLTLSLEDFRILAKRPLDMLIGAIAQFFIMPCLAWSIVHVLRLPTALAAGLILVGCCPGGVSSNIMSFLCKGDVAFSVGMTTVSTCLAPFMTPLLMFHLAGETIDVPAVAMFKSILIVTIIPVATGLLLNTFCGKSQGYRHALRLAPGVAVLALACIVGGVTAAQGSRFLHSGLIIFAAVAIHNFGGYLLGYLAGKLTRMNTAKCRTLSIEVGMQNAGLGTVLATQHFPQYPEAAIAAAVSCVWHSISGAVLAGLFLFWENHFGRGKTAQVEGLAESQK